MECQKIINLLDNTTNYPSIFRIRNWVEINDESKARYRISNIRFRDGPTLNANLSSFWRTLEIPLINCNFIN